MRLILAVLLALLLAACSSSGGNAGNQPQASLAVLLTSAADFAVTGTACHGIGQFGDITVGEAVTVIEPGGITASTTRLHDGVRNSSGACEFDEPLDVPLAMSYTVSVGAHAPAGPYFGNVGLITIPLN